MQRLGLGALGLLLGDGAGLDHRVEHQVAPLDGAVGMAEGIEVVRALNDAGQHRALGQVELLHILAEVGLRSLAKAVDREAAALAEVDLVGIHFEDLLLVEAMLELEGDHDLRELVLDGARVGEEEQLGQLHGQRGCAAAMLAVADQVVPCPADHAEVVDAAVLEEACGLQWPERPARDWAESRRR